MILWRNRPLLDNGSVNTHSHVNIGQRLANVRLLRSSRTFAWQRVSESLKAGIVHCWARFGKHIFATTGLVALELTNVPATTDTQINTNEPFRGVFCFRSASDYKRYLIRFVRQTSFVQVSQSGREDARGPGRNVTSLRASPIVICYN
jgi:hypothetical protein